jgi:hypothetical protein
MSVAGYNPVMAVSPDSHARHWMPEGWRPVDDMLHCTTVSTWVNAPGWVANRNLSGNGKVNTHCRTGACCFCGSNQTPLKVA